MLQMIQEMDLDIADFRIEEECLFRPILTTVSDEF